MKKFSLLIMVFMLFCFALTACETNSDDIVGIIGGSSSNSISEQTSLSPSESSFSTSVGGTIVNSTVSESAETSNSLGDNSTTNSVSYESSDTSNSTSSAYPEINPIESSAIVLLIDYSSGMSNGAGSENFVAQYGKTRIQVVQEAFLQVVNQKMFGEKSFIAAIFFGGRNGSSINPYSTPIKALDLTSTSNVSAINNALLMDITAITGGQNYLGSTEWRHALEAATEILKPLQGIYNKHIFMITDGAGNMEDGESSRLNGYPDGGWKVYGPTVSSGPIPSGMPDKCYTDFIYDRYGITTSTLNVACSLSPAKEYIAELECNGATYYGETAEELANAIYSEGNRISKLNIDLEKPDNSGSSSHPSADGVEDATFDGENLYIPKTEIPSGTSYNASIVIQRISAIECITPFNYKAVESRVPLIEEAYKALTENEKEEVINYKHLVYARDALNNLENKYAKAYKFIEIMDSLPAVTDLKDIHFSLIYQAEELYDEHYDNIKTILSNDFTSYERKLIACINKAYSIEKTYIAQDGDGDGVLGYTFDKNFYLADEFLGTKIRGQDFKIVSNYFNIVDDVSSGNSDLFHTYSDENNTDVKIWQYTNFTSFTFTAPTKGTLTLYVAREQNQTYSIASGLGTETYTSGSTEESCVFEIEVSGTVTISVDSGTGYLCAIKFSYMGIE